MPHLLLVDDDALLRRSMSFVLERAGYQVSAAATGEDALKAADLRRPDLVLLDIGLPGMDGLDVLQALRDRFDVPVIFVTARRRELDEVLGLRLGADDYVTKPFDNDVLLAHIKAVLRRGSATHDDVPAAPTPLAVGALTIDAAAHVVTLRGQPLELPPREFDLLHALALGPGRVVSTNELLSRVWGAEFEGESQVVYVHIRWLREKLERDPNHPRWIVTVRGVGYRLDPQED